MDFYICLKLSLKILISEEKSFKTFMQKDTLITSMFCNEISLEIYDCDYLRDHVELPFGINCPTIENTSGWNDHVLKLRNDPWSRHIQKYVYIENDWVLITKEGFDLFEMMSLYWNDSL